MGLSGGRSQEAWALAQVLGLYVAGTAVAWDHPIVATVLLGLGMQQAGWLAHDYVHGRGAWCENMRWFGAIFNGHSAEWWSQKHSLHHSFTNEEKHDNDIMMEPFFYLRSPKVCETPLQLLPR
jgi:fatty acid desaturase